MLQRLWISMDQLEYEAVGGNVAEERTVPKRQSRPMPVPSIKKLVIVAAQKEERLTYTSVGAREEDHFSMVNCAKTIIPLLSDASASFWFELVMEGFLFVKKKKT